MLRLNGHYLYEVGSQLHPLSEVTHDMPVLDVFRRLIVAEAALGPLMYNSVYPLRTCRQNGNELLRIIRKLIERLDPQQEDLKLEFFDIFTLQEAFTKFEAVLAAELNVGPIYLVMRKGGFDVDQLILEGEVVFPDDLPNKVPEAVGDIQQATRCLAFELPTACGFHLHRANESVLRRYYDAVTGGATRPQTRNIGDYLVELNKMDKGDPRVRSALKDLKDLHRNPLIHPDHSLENSAEAVALLGSVQAVVTHMLKVIPVQPSSAPPTSQTAADGQP